MDGEMNKWYFSKNGSIIEITDIESIKAFVIANPDFYGWQPSYTQWLPLHCISDFADIIPISPPLAEIPQDIIDEFNKKEKCFVEKLKEVNIDISNSEVFAQKFVQEINDYKQITQRLSPEVQANINSIEEQYCLLQQRLKDIKQSTHFTANKISKVVTDFNLRITNKLAVSSTTEPQNSIAKQISEPETITTEPQNSITKQISEPETITTEPQNSITKQISEPETITTEPQNSITKQISKPETIVKPTVDIETEEAIKEELNTESSEPIKDIQTDTKIITTRSSRPPGAKVISTRSKKLISAEVISTKSTESDQVENTIEKTIAQDEQITSTHVNTTVTAQPEPTEITTPSVLQKTQATIKQQEKDPANGEIKTASDRIEATAIEEPSKDHSQSDEHNKLKDKIGDSVKNIFNSMFNTESSSPSISLGLKELAIKKEEEELESITEGEDDSLPKKQKRRRRR